MAKQRRWVCPKCQSAKLAPSKPRKKDTRRFCLPCSEETGFLVERTCPALDREREEKATKAKAREETRLKKQEIRDRKKYDVGGLDFREEWRRLLKISRWAPSQLELNFRRSKAKELTSSSFQQIGLRPRWAANITVGSLPEYAYASLIWVMAWGTRNQLDRLELRRRLNLELRRLARKAYGIEISKDNAVFSTARQMMQKIREGLVPRFRPPGHAGSHDITRLRKLADMGDVGAKQELKRQLDRGAR